MDAESNHRTFWILTEATALSEQQLDRAAARASIGLKLAISCLMGQYADPTITRFQSWHLSFMQIGLCMMVKNEANRIERCLRDILDLFADVIIFDTGSTDATQEILRDSLGIQPVAAALKGSRCFSFGDLRNYGIAQLKTPWIFCLDADEQLPRPALERLAHQPDPVGIAGYFCPWPTYCQGQQIYLDYKLPLFRRHIQRVGLVHDNVQLFMRSQHEQAIWRADLPLHHYPETQKQDQKTRFYLKRLFCAIRQEPQGYRYYWFIGYTFFRAGLFEQATYYLSIAAESQSQQFPVECLNSHMILAEIQAQHHRPEAVRTTLATALNFYSRVRHDFEVQINFRLKPWLLDASEKCETGQLEQIRAYRFAY